MQKKRPLHRDSIVDRALRLEREGFREKRVGTVISLQPGHVTETTLCRARAVVARSEIRARLSRAASSNIDVEAELHGIRSARAHSTPVRFADVNGAVARVMEHLGQQRGRKSVCKWLRTHTVAIPVRRQ